MNFLILIILGLGWGLSFTLGKIAITAGGTPIGLTFWQSLFSVEPALGYKIRDEKIKQRHNSGKKSSSKQEDVLVSSPSS